APGERSVSDSVAHRPDGDGGPVTAGAAVTGTAGGSGPLARRAAWTMAGQALSSSSNFVVTLWALATVSPGQFATLSLCITTFLLVTQLGRAVVSLPVLVLYSEDPGRQVPPACRAALGAGAGLGLAAAAGVTLGVAVSAAVTGSLGGSGSASHLFLVLAVALPMLQYQDTLRHVCIARHRPGTAAASDAAWVGLQVAAFLALAAAGRLTVTTLLGAWVASGALAGVGVGAALGLVPRLGPAAGWLRSNAVLCRRLMGEFVAGASSYYVVWYGLAVVAGTAQLAHLRAAQALFGPVSVLLLGGTVLGVPESVRARRDQGALRRFTTRLSLALVGVALVSGAVLFALLPVTGPRVLPQAWSTARPLIPLLTLFGAGIGASAGALAGLRAVGAGRWILAAQGGRGAVAVLAGLPASAAFGARGALGGLALAEWLFAAAAWSRFGAVGGRSEVASPTMSPGRPVLVASGSSVGRGVVP
ncbi:MAG: hypothetical protein ACRDZW_09770, partial [Acidimicrobiales bacterium]